MVRSFRGVGVGSVAGEIDGLGASLRSGGERNGLRPGFNAAQGARLGNQSIERFDRVVIGAFLAEGSDLCREIPCLEGIRHLALESVLVDQHDERAVLEPVEAADFVVNIGLYAVGLA